MSKKKNNLNKKVNISKVKVEANLDDKTAVKKGFKWGLVLIFVIIIGCVGWFVVSNANEPQKDPVIGVVPGLEEFGELVYDDFGMPLFPEGVEREPWMVDYFGRHIYDGLTKDEAREVFWGSREENAGKDDKNGLNYDEMMELDPLVYHEDNKFQNMLTDDTYLGGDFNDLRMGLIPPRDKYINYIPGPKGEELEEMFNDLFEAIDEEAIDYTDEWLEILDFKKNNFSYVKGMHSKTTSILALDFATIEDCNKFLEHMYETDGVNGLTPGVATLEMESTIYFIDAPNAMQISNRIRFYYAELKPEYEESGVPQW